MRPNLLLPTLSLLLTAPAAAQEHPLKDKRRLMPQAAAAPAAHLQRQARKRQVESMTQRVLQRTRGMLRTKRIQSWGRKFKVYKRWARRKVNRFRSRFRFKRHNRHRVVTSATRSRRFRPWLSRQALRIRNRFMSARLNRLRHVEGPRLRLPRGLGGLWRDMRTMFSRPQRARTAPPPLNLGFSQLP